jgi:hypothetical protein
MDWRRWVARRQRSEGADKDDVEFEDGLAEELAEGVGESAEELERR